MKMPVLFFLFVCVCCKGYSQQNIPGQVLYSSEFTIDQVPRGFMYYMPLHYGAKEAYPLVIMLHSEDAAAKAFVKAHGDILHALADSMGCVIVYPQAVAKKWNSDDGQDTLNDAGFLSILIDYFVQQYECDAGQVYIAGFGNGADMVWRMVCTFPQKIKAVAAVSAKQAAKCTAPNIAVMEEGKSTVREVLQYFKQHMK